LKTDQHRASAGYRALLQKYPPRPIRTDDEHQRAIAVINALVDRPTLYSARSWLRLSNCG
jgi:hypothetical protein